METKTKEAILGYKGFDSKLQCQKFQFEVGESYHSNTANLCHGGFHFCLRPLDIFNYYQPAGSRYCIVKATGTTSQTDDDSKRVCTDIEIVREISLRELIDAGVDFIKQHFTDNQTNTGDESAATNTGDGSAATNTGCGSAAANTGNRSAATNTGDWSAAANTGNRSAATNTGDRSAATNTGNRSAATNTGDESAATNTGCGSAAANTGNRSAATVSGADSVAIATGYEGKARGALGCGIVVAEHGEWNGKTYPLLAIKATIVDGEEIKADKFYTLKKGEFVEA